MAKKNFYVHVDMNKNQLQQVVIENSGTAPLTPALGQLYYDDADTDAGKLFLWNGAWVDLTKQGVVDGDYGDITVSSSGTVFTVDPDSITYDKMQDIVGTNVLLGAISAGTVTELTATQVRTILNITDGATAYDDEQAQDAVGNILVDSSQIDFTYNDTTPSITASVIDDSITYAKLQNAVANNVFLANNNGATSAFEEITGTAATAMLDTFTAALKGLAPASGGGTTNWLRADGTWAAIPAGFAGFTVSGDSGSESVVTGDTTAFTTGAGLTTATSKATTTVTTQITIDTAGVTNAMLATMPAYSVKVNNTAGVASPGTEVGLTANTVLGRVAAGIVAIAIDNDLATTSASHDTIPSALAVKNAIGTAVTNGMTYKGAFDPTSGAGAGSPDLDAITSEVGDTYTVTVAGTYNWTTGSAVLEIGDTLIAEEAGVLSNVSQWTILNRNLDGVVIGPASAVGDNVAFFDGVTGELIKDSGLTLSGSNTGDEGNASETVAGIAEEATDAEVAAGTATGGTGAKLFITPAKLKTHLGETATLSTAKVFRLAIGNGALTSIPVTHNIGEQFVSATVVRTGSPYDIIECEVQCTSTTVTTFIFNTAPTSGEFNVIITG